MAVIKFLHLRGNIYLRKLKPSWTLFTRTLSHPTCYREKKANEFKRGRTSLADDERSGRPTTG